jgi:universal stress protein E
LTALEVPEDVQQAGESEAFTASVRQLLDELVAQAAARGVSAAGEVVSGDAWREICRRAAAGSCELVVVGTREAGRASRLLFGSTGMKLLRYCPCPVWITKPDEPRDEPEVLVASDLSEVSRDALEIGVTGARLMGAKLWVVHALEHQLEQRLRHVGLSDGTVEQMREHERREVEHALHEQLACTDYRTLPYGVQVRVVDGQAETVILGMIEEHRIDLLVMGTVARTGLSGLLVGNTAEQIMPQVPCSILAVKPRGFQCPVSFD